MARRERVADPITEEEYERMPERIEAAFDRVRHLLPDSESSEE